MSLKVFEGEKVVFYSEGSWLYPIFELEDFLAGSGLKGENLYAVDTKIGRAAALLFFRLGLRKIHGDLMSQLAADYCESHGVSYTYNELVPKIACKTEDLITSEMGMEEAYILLAGRAGRT